MDCLLPCACGTWQSPADRLATDAATVVQVSIGQDSVLVIGTPQIRGDSLVGVVSRTGSNPPSVYGCATTHVV